MSWWRRLFSRKSDPNYGLKSPEDFERAIANHIAGHQGILGIEESLRGVTQEPSSCGNCTFFRASDDKCRRYPPVLAPNETQRIGTGRYPETKAEDWCGEHRN